MLKWTIEKLIWNTWTSRILFKIMLYTSSIVQSNPQMELNLVKVRLQTCWYLLFSHLPSSWNLAQVVAFVENLESINWHLSFHSTGRTHPHRLGTVLANTTDTDIGSYCINCMISYSWLGGAKPMNIILTLSVCVVAGLYVCRDKKRQMISAGRGKEKRCDMRWWAWVLGMVRVILDEPNQILVRQS